jgi:hypothetical protein
MQTYNLLIIIGLVIIQFDVEESQLIHTFLCGNHPQPIPQLQVSLVRQQRSHTFCFFKNFFVRYFRYRPLNLAPLATTTIFPSSREIEILSPKFPVRLSTLILSWRNFSKAEGSKILSFVGADASRTYCLSIRMCVRETYFLGCLLRGGLAGFLRSQPTVSRQQSDGARCGGRTALGAGAIAVEVFGDGRWTVGIAAN